jgi:predicted nucleic acid-binding protein
LSVIVDTSIWSGVFRKGGDSRDSQVVETLSRRGLVDLLGPIRQEVLSGIHDAAQFEFIRERLAAFVDLPLEKADYEQAAALFNRCRARGIQGSNTDFLICVAASRRGLRIYTADNDFELFARYIRFKRYRP